MKLEYLGDAFDHWKGSLIGQLREKRLVRNLLVVPMINDPDPWKSEDFDTYAELLHVERASVLELHFRRMARRSYFDTIDPKRDLFLDPDTGIQTGQQSPVAKYVKPEEIRRLLAAGRARLLMVYQHGARGQTIKERIRSVMQTPKIDDLCWCSYESNASAILFLSRDCGRIDRIARHFRKILHGCARNRVQER